MAQRKPEQPVRSLSVMRSAGVRPPAVLDDLSGKISEKKLAEIQEEYTTHVIVGEGMNRKRRMAIGYKQEGYKDAWDESMDYFEHAQRGRDVYAGTNPEAFKFADQLMQQSTDAVSNSHFDSAHAFAGRQDDIALRSIDPRPEPERQPGWWERIKGGA